MAFSRAGFAGFQFAGNDAPYDAVSRRAALDRLDMLATVFDTAFIVPGTPIRFGVESLIRFIPGIGDIAASALSFYLLYEARRLGVPRLLLARMLANVLLEGTVGMVPVAGDAFDVFFRANRRNIALLRAHFARVGY
jgi:GNAT superfamily N-acetyltransferase